MVPVVCCANADAAVSASAHSNVQAVRAVRLWAAAVNLGALAIPPFVVRLVEERLLTPLRDTLGNDEFREQWATGQALSPADTIAYTLKPPSI